jgi:hypothetical protein
MPPEAIRHDWIIDELRQAEKVSVWDNAAGYMEAVKRSYLRDNWQDQEFASGIASIIHCELLSVRA